MEDKYEKDGPAKLFQIVLGSYFILIPMFAFPHFSYTNIMFVIIITIIISSISLWIKKMKYFALGLVIGLGIYLLLLAYSHGVFYTA